VVVLQDGYKFENVLFVSIQYSNVTDGRTDYRQTPHNGIGHAMHSDAHQK